MSNEELALRIQAGENYLFGELWEQNIKLFNMKASSLYNRYRERCQASGVEIDDIVQVCFFALCDAVRAYKPESEYKLTTYIAYPLLNHLRALLGIRTLKRDPLNYSDSLDKKVGENGDTDLIELIADKNNGDPYETITDDDYQQKLYDVLEESISKLPEDRAILIRKRYFENIVLKELSETMGISRQRVHQLERDALLRLRKFQDLQLCYNEVMCTWAYRGVNVDQFNRTRTSSVERAILKADDMLDCRTA